MEVVQTKSLACQASQNWTSEEGKKSYQNRSDGQFSATNFVNQPLTNTKPYKIVKILQWFFVLFPIFLGILVFLYDKYLIYRATVFQQQVEMLERLWQSIEQ